MLVLVVSLTVSASLWAEPVGYSVNSRGNFAENNLVNALWQIDLATGAETYIGWTSYLDLEALAMDEEGKLWGADDATNTLVRVSAVTGLAVPAPGTTQFNMGLSQQPLDFGMAFDCEGDLWVVSDIKQSLYRANLETGKLTLVGSEGSLGAPITDIAVRGQKAYGIGVGLDANGNALAPNLYRVDLDEASAELIGPLGSDASPYNNAGLDFDEDGLLWAITDRRAVGGQDLPSQILRIDLDTGQATRIADTIVGLESLAIAAPVACDEPEGNGPLPEPALVPVFSLPGVLLMLALIALLAWWQLKPRRS